MSNENPMNSRETFDKNINNLQEKALRENQEFDEAKAAEEKAQRETVLAEQAKVDAGRSQKEAAELLEKLKNDNIEGERQDITKFAQQIELVDFLLQRKIDAIDSESINANQQLHYLQNLDSNTLSVILKKSDNDKIVISLNYPDMHGGTDEFSIAFDESLMNDMFGLEPMPSDMYLKIKEFEKE